MSGLILFRKADSSVQLESAKGGLPSGAAAESELVQLYSELEYSI